MNLKAKFVCNAVKYIKYCGKKSEVIEAMPVYSTSEENKTWSEATPSGSLSMTISNPSAFGALEPGQEFFIDITPIEVKP